MGEELRDDMGYEGFNTHGQGTAGYGYNEAYSNEGKFLSGGNSIGNTAVFPKIGEGKVRKWLENYFAMKMNQKENKPFNTFDRGMGGQEIFAGKRAENIKAEKDMINSLRRKLLSYGIKDMDIDLLNDKYYGKYYNDMRDDCFNMMRLAGRNGIKTNLREVFNTLIANKLPEILEGERNTARKSSLKNVYSNRSASPGALSNNAFEQRISVADMPESEFKKLQQRVLAGERIRL